MVSKENARCLRHIMEHIRSGGSYAESAENVRYPYDHKALYQTVHGNIGWSHYGSSAESMTMRNLNWTIRTIFEMTPSAFLMRYKELPAGA